MPYSTLSRAPYANHRVLSPSGEFLFFGDEAKCRWYMSRGLATLEARPSRQQAQPARGPPEGSNVALGSEAGDRAAEGATGQLTPSLAHGPESSEGSGLADPDSMTIRLTFEPKGAGRVGDPYYSVPLANRCVVCGWRGGQPGPDLAPERGLVKQQLVPREYRVWFPERLKSHASHDIVPLCRQCHDSYSRPMGQLKRRLLEEWGVVPREANTRPASAVCARRSQAVKLIRTLQNHSTSLPPDRVVELQTKLGLLLELPVETAAVRELEPFLELAIKAEAKLSEEALAEPTVVPTPAGQRVVERVIAAGALDSFVQRWRRHFLATMQPQFMPGGWSPTRPLDER